MRLVTGVIVLLTFGTRCDSKVTQPISQEVTEGQEVNLPCSHQDISTNMNVFWYRQFPNQGPQFLIQTYKTNVTDQMVSLTISPDRKSSTLSLPPVALRDTAVYYCLLQRAQCEK
uniref:Ig-like domain-containing protein n=1 Tax=Vombatus ursinus TaxID=29139 RepID=A0A4X2LRH1_VOMUR